MWYEIRYLQFNDLVFDGYDMISDWDSEVSFKATTHEYSFRDGSYAPFKNKRLYARAKSVNMTITLQLKKIPCEYREFYMRFAETQLSGVGKLWAIKNNELVWAYAYVENRSMVIHNRANEVTYDVEFMIYEGVWHKADKQKTFLLPYNVCVFMECKGYKKVNPCVGTMDGDCCEVCEESKIQQDIEERCYCCCVDEVTPEMALCYHSDLQDFYGCDTPYQIVYDCVSAEKFNDYLGQKLCVKDKCDDSVIAGRFYSETDLSTDDVMVTLKGQAHNPWITINGNTNIIEGDFDGILTIHPSGDVYYSKDECCEGDLLDPDVWKIPEGNTYGWEIQPQYNSIIVNLNQCCAGLTCVYIQHEAITA